MAIKERKQITGTEAQIKGYAGHNGVLAYATDTKHLHVLSGTAGTTTKLANMSDIPAPVDISGKADTTYVNAELAKKANASHMHTITNVTNLQTALDAKASNADLSSLEAEVTKDLQAVNTALEGKANSSHTHTVSQITDMPNVVLSVNNIAPASGGNVNLGLHAVATSGDYNDLRNKPTIPSSPDVYVTTQYKNGSNGYRVWSNGFIEQWGIYDGDTYNITINDSYNSAVNVTLHKAFSTNTYHIYTTQSFYSSSYSDYAAVYRPNTTTTKFSLIVNGNRYQYCYWYACGY